MTTSAQETRPQNGTKPTRSEAEEVPPKPERVEGTQGTEASWDKKALSVDTHSSTLVVHEHSGQPKRINPDSGQFIRIVVGGVLLAGLVAFAISFVALYQVAEWLGLPPWMWWAVPIFIDVMLLVSAGLALIYKARGEKTWPAWSALGAFTVLSMIANGAHALAHPHETQWQAYIGVLIAAMVPIAIFVATEHLSRVAIQDMNSRKVEIREQFELESFTAEQQRKREDLEFEREQRQWERQNKRIQAQRASELEQRKHEQQLAALAAEPTQQPVTDQQPAAPQATATGSPAKRQTVSEHSLMEFVSEQVRQGTEVTGQQVAEFLNVSDRTGRRRLNELKDNHPDLFTDQSSATNSGVSQE